jgi:hypothetical protein
MGKLASGKMVKQVNRQVGRCASKLVVEKWARRQAGKWENDQAGLWMSRSTGKWARRQTCKMGKWANEQVGNLLDGMQANTF